MTSILYTFSEKFGSRNEGSNQLSLAKICQYQLAGFSACVLRSWSQFTRWAGARESRSDFLYTYTLMRQE